MNNYYVIKKSSFKVSHNILEYSKFFLNVHLEYIKNPEYYGKFCVLVFVDSTFVYKWRRNLLVTSLREFSTFVNQNRMICRL